MRFLRAGLRLLGLVLRLVLRLGPEADPGASLDLSLGASLDLNLRYWSRLALISVKRPYEPNISKI